MSRKIDFVERARAPGAKLAPLCREFGISRQTGHKWLRRFEERGFEGLDEESRRPKTSPLAFTEELVVAVLEARDAHPNWGPKKIHLLLRRRFGEQAPSRSTVARMLRRFGRIRERRTRRPLSFVDKAPTVRAEQPNDVWTVDFKGWWRSHDGSKCEPLTVRDAFSRFVLAVTLARTSYKAVRPILEALFRKHGLPAAIQCDNGTPFVCARSRAGLSRLSAWWVSLGIRIIRSRPACPQDNGGHERMHRDIAGDVERAPAQNLAAQQRILDRWRQEFNQVRPHEALEGKTPAELYRPSERRHRDAVPATYPPHFVIKHVFNNGGLSINGDQYFVSLSLAGHDVGLEQLDELRWRIWFHDIDCGELEILPEWIDHFVPREPGCPPNRPKRHDARRRTRPRAAATRRPSSIEDVSERATA
jgi:transposase InsO family protein